ncbi:MAG TPA: contractile injection system protein, VgrG/Pvc8 family [Burkholderiales bacterium]|jgi:uncharacterized protein|nr:contractile injection system protein, VgrG/Pvc8 family [Burkholderiales bacterium]
MAALPAGPDRNFSCVVRVNGESHDTLFQCVQRVTVEEDLEVGSSFTIDLVACRNEDGSWPYIEEENLKVWNRITVYAMFPEQNEVVIDGYISEIVVSTNPDQGNVSVAIRGVDASYHMNLEEKTKIWLEMTYEEIAEEVLDSYEFDMEIAEPSEEAAATPPHAVAQRCTDHALLRELARRKGYEFFVQGAKGFFRPAKLDSQPQKLIAVNFGEETNCTQFSVSSDGTAPTVASITFLDPMTGKVMTSLRNESGLTPLGKETLDSLRGAVKVPQTIQIGRRLGCMDQARADEYGTGLLRRNGWWVTATGRLNGLKYGRVLRSRKLVTIKGVGATYNGNYYVRKVQHELTARTYTMQFEAVRNALGKLDTENFEGEKPDALIPAAAGAGADTDVIAVAGTGPRVLPA